MRVGVLGGDEQVRHHVPAGDQDAVAARAEDDLRREGAQHQVVRGAVDRAGPHVTGHREVALGGVAVVEQSLHRQVADHDERRLEVEPSGDVGVAEPDGGPVHGPAGLGPLRAVGEGRGRQVGERQLPCLGEQQAVDGGHDVLRPLPDLSRAP
ncbi:hypothetical protein GCM10017559_38650 [Streptosporangium longisporum]|uniref:Uncharacterized protein n=1 Tax=Streptosporangium longisporum TaxID=46187 RepID=A0ABN3Y5B7_9ACTN